VKIKEEAAYYSEIQLDSTPEPDWIGIPRHIAIIVSYPVQVIRANYSGKANHEASTEEKSDYNALPEREVEFQNDGDGYEHDAKIGSDIERSLNHEVDPLTNTVLRNE